MGWRRRPNPGARFRQNIVKQSGLYMKQPTAPSIALSETLVGSVTANCAQHCNQPVVAVHGLEEAVKPKDQL
eukprot:gene22938-30117_t